MAGKILIKQFCVLTLIIGLTACFRPTFQPPYNHFKINNKSTYSFWDRNSPAALIKQLQKEDIQFVQHGDTMTLVVPTDRYYVFDTPRLNDICYHGLVNIIRLLRHYPNSRIYVASFSDNIGDKHLKQKLTQARAEAMLTFLWANDIDARRLSAEGYGEHYDIAQNQLIHGSAQNRRVEIQWYTPEFKAASFSK